MPSIKSPSNSFEVLTLRNGKVLLFLMATEIEYLAELESSSSQPSLVWDQLKRH
ncbi:MAG: hypothetical protein ACSHWX_14235 [Maritalea sp.]